MNTQETRRTWIVLPAFNEEQDLPGLFKRIDDATAEARIKFELVVVDDGSTDHTAEIVEQWSNKLPIHLLSHEVNQGLGATLRDGLKWACNMATPNDLIVTLDADNSHTPDLIVRMSRMIREGHDVVIASRFRPGSRVRGLPFQRRLLSVLASLSFKLVFPIRGVRDYTCGYRAYRVAILKDATVDPNFFDQAGFQVMVDILLKLRRNPELIFGEVPLILRYDHKRGQSKMDVSSTIRDTVRLMLRRRFE